MPYWMTNPQHGVMPVYSVSEMEQARVHGWELLNEGASPLRGKPAEVKAPAMPVAEHVEIITKRKPGRPPKAKQ
jgi:hypothetical protein